MNQNQCPAGNGQAGKLSFGRPERIFSSVGVARDEREALMRQQRDKAEAKSRAMTKR